MSLLGVLLKEGVKKSVVEQKNFVLENKEAQVLESKESKETIPKKESLEPCVEKIKTDSLESICEENKENKESIAEQNMSMEDIDEKGNLEKLTKDYIDDLKKNSECPETIIDEPFTAEQLEKRPPEETKELRQEFNRDKEKLISEWEKENNREWPVYEEDVYNDYGEIVKKKGWKYDAHHIQPLSLGGKNEAKNLTPLRYDVHSDHKGVHAVGSPYDKLEKMLKEEKRNDQE